MGAVPMPGMVDMPGMPIPGIPIPVRSIIIVLVIIPTPLVTYSSDERFAGPPASRRVLRRKKSLKSLALACPPGKLC
jgi:hypothetical protein